MEDPQCENKEDDDEELVASRVRIHELEHELWKMRDELSSYKLKLSNHQEELQLYKSRADFAEEEVMRLKVCIKKTNVHPIFHRNKNKKNKNF